MTSRSLFSFLPVVVTLALIGACAGERSGGPAEEPLSDGSRVAVRLVAFNDFHGNLQPPTGSNGTAVAALGDPLLAKLGPDAGVVVDVAAGIATVPAGGAAYLATHVKALRAERPNTIVVSAGDLSGASPLLSNLFHDEPTILTMNALGLGINGVGNHEFDRGIDALRGLAKQARFEYLAANVVESQSNMTVFAPYTVKTFGGAKVAVIGMTLEATPSVTVESAVAGLAFRDEVATVNALVPELQKMGVSAIVVVVHEGLIQPPNALYDGCASSTGDLRAIVEGLHPAVDVVVSGHTHQPYDCTINGRLVTSAASFGRVLTVVDLTVDVDAKRVIEKAARNVVVSREVAPDPEVSSIIATYEAKSAPLANRVVGRVTTDIRASLPPPSCETALGDIIADAQLAATSSPEGGGAVVAFMNPGGIRTDLVHAASGTEGAGVVTYAEAFAVQPFANNLVTLTLTGAQMRTLLSQQFTGAKPRILQPSAGFSYRYTYDAATKTGAVDPTSLTIAGRLVDDAASYRVTVNAFLAGGGDGFPVLREGTARRSGVVDLDALVAWLGRNDPLSPPSAARIAGNGCVP